MRRPRIMSKMKRLEMAIESSELERVVRLIEPHATGYTLLPNATGFGEHGYKAGEITLLVTVVTLDHMEAILDAVLPVMTGRSGIVLVSDVGVMRPEHFTPEVRAAQTRPTFSPGDLPRIDRLRP